MSNGLITTIGVMCSRRTSDARCCASNTASLASLAAAFAASSAAIALHTISSAASTAAFVGGIAQRVEDPDVVVRCDGGDDASDGECCAVIFRHIRQLQYNAKILSQYGYGKAHVGIMLG